MSSADDWSRGFAVQAISDLAAREILLQSADLPECQQLHYLQMACEKVCKAHLYSEGQSALAFQTSHAYVAKVLPVVVTQHLKASRKYEWALRNIRHLARQIELLAPSVDDGGKRPDNCEYPWEDGHGQVFVRAEWTFPNLSLLTEPAGRMLIKTVVAVANRLAAQGARPE
jgi:hypothetical protein